VALIGGDRVARFTVGDAAIDTYVQLGTDPVDVSFTADGAEAYIARLGAPTIHRLRMPPLAGTTTFPAGGPNARVFPADGNSLLLLGLDGRVRRVARADGAALDSTVQLQEPALGLHRRSSDGLLAVAAGATVYLLDPATLDVLDSRAMGMTIKDVLFMPKGQRLLAAFEEEGKILMLDAISLATTDSIHDPTGQFHPFGMRLSPDERTLLVTSPSTGRVGVVDANAFTIKRLLILGGAPRRIAYGPDGRQAFVTNEAGWVDVIR
jgi:DNA-binding beta-propeller fold protein YncE